MLNGLPLLLGKKKSWIMTAWPAVDCKCSDSGCHVVDGTLESFTAVEEVFPIAAPKLVCYNMKIAGDIVTLWHSLQPHPFCFLRVFLKHLTTIHTLLLRILTCSNLFLACSILYLSKCFWPLTLLPLPHMPLISSLCLTTPHISSYMLGS
jgi:hypothetical protein